MVNGLVNNEIEQEEENVADQASAARTIKELEVEIATLKDLECMANEVRLSGEERKWDEFSRLLQDNDCMFTPDGQREKFIIFIENRATLRYLTDKIRTLFGSEDSVVTIHDGMLRDKDVRILIATDAAEEGINLQRAHLIINYDMPWHPNRLKQRFGRIHRAGQPEVCRLWNLVSLETREGMVFQCLFNKLKEERAKGYEISEIIPEHFSQVKAHKTKMPDKSAKAVKKRMTQEIQFWDYRAIELREKEAADKGNQRLTAANATRRAKALEERMQKRLSEIDSERITSAMPSTIVGDREERAVGG